MDLQVVIEGEEVTAGAVMVVRTVPRVDEVEEVDMAHHRGEAGMAHLAVVDTGHHHQMDEEVTVRVGVMDLPE